MSLGWISQSIGDIYHNHLPVLTNQYYGLNQKIKELRAAIKKIETNGSGSGGVPSEELEAINNTLKQLRTDLDTANNDIKFLTERVVETINTHNSIVTSVDSHEDKIEELGQTVTSMTQSVSQCESKVNDIESSVSSLESTVGTLESTFDGRLGSVESTVSTLETSVSTLETTLSDRVSSVESTVSSLETSVSTLESTVSSLETSVSSLESTVNTLESTIDGSRIDNIESSISTLETSIDTLESRLSERVSNVESSVGSLETSISDRIDNIGSSVSTLESTVSTLESTVSQCESNVDNRVSGVESSMNVLESTVDNKFNEMRTTLVTLNTTIDELKANDDEIDVEYINTTLSNLTTTVGTNSTQIESHDTTISAHDSRISSLETTVNNNNNSVTNHENRLSTVEEQVSTQASEVSSCKSTCTSLSTTVNNLNTNVSSMSDSVSAITNAITNTEYLKSVIEVVGPIIDSHVKNDHPNDIIGGDEYTRYAVDDIYTTSSYARKSYCMSHDDSGTSNVFEGRSLTSLSYSSSIWDLQHMSTYNPSYPVSDVFLHDHDAIEYVIAFINRIQELEATSGEKTKCNNIVLHIVSTSGRYDYHDMIYHPECYHAYTELLRRTNRIVIEAPPATHNMDYLNDARYFNGNPQGSCINQLYLFVSPDMTVKTIEISSENNPRIGCIRINTLLDGSNIPETINYSIERLVIPDSMRVLEINMNSEYVYKPEESKYDSGYISNNGTIKTITSNLEVLNLPINLERFSCNGLPLNKLKHLYLPLQPREAYISTPADLEGHPSYPSPEKVYVMRKPFTNVYYKSFGNSVTNFVEIDFESLAGLLANA